MKKILFLPFLKISSGHHQVADALRDHLYEINPQLHTNKIDILSHTFGIGERLVSESYLKAIKFLPTFYSWLYKQNSYKKRTPDKKYRIYELMFMKSMKRILAQEKPNLLICTHSLPSHLLNVLKANGDLTTPVINVYTDFFINTVWGIKFIDYHFVPSEKLKRYLEQNGVNSEKIFLTGIPIHPAFTTKKLSLLHSDTYKVLISGGNLGIGPLDKWLQSIKTKVDGKLKFFVLCGKNEELYKKLKHLNHPNIIPFPYISARQDMNELYDQMDFVITKPGGVTLSECLKKKLPIYLLDALPGQEEWNERYLIENNLVLNGKLTLNIDCLEESLLAFLKSDIEKNRHQLNLESYVSEHCEVKTVLSSVLNS